MKHTLQNLLASGKLAQLLDSMAAMEEQVVQIMTTEGALYARCNAEGKCSITDSDVKAAADVKVIPTLCIQRKCPFFKGQHFSTINACSENVGLVIGCYDTSETRNRDYVEFLSNVLSEIVSREEEIIAVSSDILVKYEELSILYEVSRSIASSFSALEVATLMLNVVAQRLGVSEGAVFLVDPESFRFRKTIALSGGICEVQATNKPHSVSDDKKFLLSSNFLSPEAEDCLKPLFKTHSAFIDRKQAGKLLLQFDAPETFLVPLVHQSQIDGKEELLGAMALAGKGKSDFSKDDSHFLRILTAQGALGIINCQAVKRLRENERLTRDLELGQSIQRSFFPAKAPEGDTFELHGQCNPARNVGGDYFDYFVNPQGLITIVIADVSGHHLGSAILMASIRSVLRTALHSDASPAEVLEIANRMMYQDMDRAGSFVSVFIASFDPVTRVINCASAGHEPALLIVPAVADLSKQHSCSSNNICLGEDKRESCSFSSRIDIEGILIGVVPDYSFEETSITLSPGSLLYLYTDGVIEARADGGRLFGRENLSRLLCQNRHESVRDICEMVKATIKTFSSGSEQQDDLAMVALKVL